MGLMTVKPSKHRYIFYFFPKVDLQTGEVLKGYFAVFSHAKEGKAKAQELKREYDYEKIF